MIRVAAIAGAAVLIVLCDTDNGVAQHHELRVDGSFAAELGRLRRAALLNPQVSYYDGTRTHLLCAYPDNDDRP